MAKPQNKRSKKKAGVPDAELPQQENYLIILGGIAVILVGYIVMGMGDAVSPLSVTIAPIILIVGYCIIVPFGIMRRKRAKARA